MSNAIKDPFNRFQFLDLSSTVGTVLGFLAQEFWPNSTFTESPLKFFSELLSSSKRLHRLRSIIVKRQTTNVTNVTFNNQFLLKSIHCDIFYITTLEISVWTIPLIRYLLRGYRVIPEMHVCMNKQSISIISQSFLHLFNYKRSLFRANVAFLVIYTLHKDLKQMVSSPSSNNSN